MEIRVHEVVPKCGTRTDLGRVVIKPPKVMGPLKLREECRFRMCCNRAFLTEESYRKHQEETTEHGKPLDFSQFPKPEPEVPSQLEQPSPPPTTSMPRSRLSHLSSREFWIRKKEGAADKVFEVNDRPELDLDINGHDQGGLQRVTVMDVDRYTGTGRKRKKCDICNLNTEQMTRHLRICHSSGEYKCQFCPCTFILDRSRSLHQGSMHKVIARTVATVARKQNIVARAKKQLVSVSTKLSKDIESQLGKGKVPQCPVCQKMFANLNNAREHLNSHYGIRPYKCEKCSVTFNYSSSLRRHKKTAHSSSTTRFFCNVCKRGFSSNRLLGFHRRSVHMKNPSSIRNDMVSNGLKFKNVPFLTLQQPTRNTEGLYECHICDKKLTTPQTLRGHMLIHQNLKPYTCTLCGVSFRLHSTRRNHIKNCHTNGPFRCKDCTCSFNFQGPLDRHHGIYHSKVKSPSKSNPFMEGISSNSLSPKKKSTSLSTSSDSEVTGFKCTMCGIIINRLEDFNKHKLLHSTNVEKNTCNFCLKKFTIANNVSMHKKRAHGGGSHKCPFCCCQYHGTGSLSNHLTKEHGMDRGEWDFKKKCIKPEAIKRIQIHFYESSVNKSENVFPLEETTGRTIEDPKTGEISNNAPQTIDLPFTKKRNKGMIECDLCNLKVSFLALRAHQKRSHYNSKIQINLYNMQNDLCQSPPVEDHTNELIFARGGNIDKPQAHLVAARNCARLTRILTVSINGCCTDLH